MQTAFNLRNIGYRSIISIPFLDIAAGTFFGVTGKSGSGKTTLLKLLNNILTCDRGEISYYGINILKLDPVVLRRRAVMVPQAPFIFPGTAMENIQLVFHFNRKKVPVQAEIEKLFELLEVSSILHSDTSNLSGGEKQRLALARVLLLDPETLLLDEPTAALDRESAQTVFNCLARWVRQPGKTVVAVSHSDSLIGEFADTVLDLSGGLVNRLEERRDTRA